MNRSIVKSFSFAFSGVKTALKEEPNFKIHTTFSAIALVLAYFLEFSTIEWLILIFTIFLVLILELINTAVEEIVNIVSPQISKEARVAKDVIAAAVLFGAILSIIVGLILFLPKVSSFF